MFACLTAIGLLHADELPPPAEQYQAYLSQIRSVSFTSVFYDRVVERSDEFTNCLRQDWKIDFNEKRLWSKTVSQRLPQTPGEELVPADTYFELLTTPTCTQTVTADTTSQKVTTVTSYLEAPADYWQMNNKLLYLAFPFGFIETPSGRRDLATMLEGASSSENADSSVTLSKSCKEYKLSVLLIPSNGWAAKEIHLMPRVSSEKGSLSRMDYIVDGFMKSGACWFPEEYQCEITQAVRRTIPGLKEYKQVEEGDASSITLAAKVSISDTEFRPFSDDDFRIQSEIANGKSVIMVDAQQLGYVWLDGEVVPNPGILPNVSDQDRFVGGGTRWWLVIVNTVLVIVIIGYLGVRRMAK